MGAYSIPVVIGIDEEAIAKEVQKNVEDRVVEYISGEIKEVMYYRSAYYNSENPLKNMIKSHIEQIIDENKEKIFEMAAEKLADKLARTKAIRARAGAIVDEVLG